MMRPMCVVRRLGTLVYDCDIPLTLLSLPSAPLTRFVIDRPAHISLPVMSLVSRMISRRQPSMSWPAGSPRSNSG